MKGLLKEFKEFALRGNVLDLSVGVLIGGSFQSIVKSLTENVIAPFIGIFATKDFSDLTINILGANIKYGLFVTSVINFFITAFLIFLIVKGINRISIFGKKNEVEDTNKATTQKCPYCCTEIDINASRCPNCTSILKE